MSALDFAKPRTPRPRARLTREEQAAIDAFDARKIKKLPTRATSSMVWDKRRRKYVGVGVVLPADPLPPNAAQPAARRRQPKGPRGEHSPRVTMAIDLAKEGRTAKEIAEAMGIKVGSVYVYLSGTGVKCAAPERVKRPRKQSPRPESKKSMIIRMAPDHTARELAENLGTSPHAVYNALRDTGVKCKPAQGREREPSRTGDKAREKKEAKAVAGAAKVRDRRRFKSVPVPFGDPAIRASKDAEGSIFPTRVFDPVPDEWTLKDGSNNSKIGGDVLVGWLKGARIYTLTLEERATCPRSCALWEGCYGNAMQYARRWRHGPELEARIREDVAELCASFDKVLVRLHVLGDFYSLDYVTMWGALMVEHEGLAAFGFTAHLEDSEIGAEIARIRSDFGRRWSIRHSGRTGEWGSFTLDFPTAKKRIGDAIVCPEQRDAMEGGGKNMHCGSCAACWSSSVPVAFVEH